MKCDCKLYLCDDNGVRYFGYGPWRLLQAVARTGSLSAAAASLYLSYKKALRMVRSAEEGFGAILLASSAGGADGGGSALTEDGRALVEAYEHFDREAKAAVTERFAHCFAGFSRHKT